MRWWLDELNTRTLYEVARAPTSALAQIPSDALAKNIDFAIKTHKPVFVGHYWLTGTPEPLSHQSGLHRLFSSHREWLSDVLSVRY